jgi:hypothetical protein
MSKSRTARPKRTSRQTAPSNQGQQSTQQPNSQPASGGRDNTKPHAQNRCKDTKKEHTSRLEYITTSLALLAVIASGAAAGFAGWQAWIAKDSEVVGNRAFVISNSAKFLSYEEPYKLDRKWEITPIIDNVGNTPTVYLRYSHGTGLCYNGLPDDLGSATDQHSDIWKRGTKNRYQSAIIGPKSEIAAAIVGFSDVKINCQVAITEYMIAKYKDIFGYSHISESCYYMLRGVVNDFASYPIGQSIRVFSLACRAHNCADSECGPDWKERANDPD